MTPHLSPRRLMQNGFSLFILCALLLFGTPFSAHAQAAKAQPLFAQAFELMKTGNLQDAAGKFEAGLRADPKNALAHFYLAESYYGLKQNTLALGHYRQSLKLNVSSDVAAQARDRLTELTQTSAPKPASVVNLAPGKEFKDCANCPAMIVIPAGQFVMGSPPSEIGRLDNEGPAHLVTIAKPFAAGKYEVTFDEWDACVADQGCSEADDKGWGRGKRPVINVSYDQAVAYTEWLSAKTKKKYRLLSEAEWEYAARAGSDKARYWGGALGQACQFANVNDQTSKRVNNFSWENFDCDDGYAQTAPVGNFKPNDFGLYDTLGNVWEWVGDCYNKTYDGAPGDDSAWSAGDCSLRAVTVRGGSWFSMPADVRSASSVKYTPSARIINLGFRLARTLP